MNARIIIRPREEDGDSGEMEEISVVAYVREGRVHVVVEVGDHRLWECTVRDGGGSEGELPVGGADRGD